MITVVAAIIQKNDTYLIARRAPHKVHPGKWEFPGGKVDQGEAPEKALERELFEEFRILTKTGKHVISSEFDYGTFKIKLMAYEVQFLEGSFQLKDHDQIAWVSLKDIKHYDLSEADLAIRTAL